MARVVSMDNI